jgi:hypothetical protein
LEPVRDYELKAFFTYVVQVLERLGIPYMVVGGFAATLYGEPRLTLDVDIVADVKQEHVAPFVAAFPIPSYYVSEEGIQDSIRRRYPFNVIQPSTGAKIDLVPLSRDPLSLGAFQRRQAMTYDETGQTASFIAAEDLIVAKLRAFRDTGSDRHLRDARGILLNQWTSLDFSTVRGLAHVSGVNEALEQMLDSMRGSM